MFTYLYKVNTFLVNFYFNLFNNILNTKNLKKN